MSKNKEKNKNNEKNISQNFTKDAAIQALKNKTSPDASTDQLAKEFPVSDSSIPSVTSETPEDIKNNADLSVPEPNSESIPEAESQSNSENKITDNIPEPSVETEVKVLPESTVPFVRADRHILTAADIEKFPEFTRDGWKEGQVVSPGPDEIGNFQFRKAAPEKKKAGKVIEEEIAISDELGVKIPVDAKETKSTPKTEKPMPQNLEILANGLQKMFDDRAKTILAMPTFSEVIKFAGPASNLVSITDFYKDDEKTTGYLILAEFNTKVRVPAEGFFKFGKDYSKGA